MGNLSNPNAFSGIVKGLGEGGGSVDFPTDITNPQDGQLLKYDATSEKWVNADNEPCVVDVIVTEEDRQATSDDVTNYINDINGTPIVADLNYTVVDYGISINDLELNKIYRIKDELTNYASYSFISLFSYRVIDNVYKVVINLYNPVSNTFTDVDFYVLNKDLNLKMFIDNGST